MNLASIFRPTILLPGLLFPFLVSAQIPSDVERESICRTLTLYFNGFELNDPEALARAYHEQARFTMIEPDQNGYEVLEFGAYLSAIADHPPKTMNRTLSVKQLEWTGNVAYVHAVIEYSGRGQRIHDYLLLQKEEEDWKIVNRTSVREFASFDEEEGDELRSREILSLEQELMAMIKSRQEEEHFYLSAFAPHGDVSFVDPREGILTRLDMAGYEDLLETQEPTRRVKQSFDFLHVSREVVVIKVRTKVPKFGCFLVDYMTLVSDGESWKIIHKATHKPNRAISVTP